MYRKIYQQCDYAVALKSHKNGTDHYIISLLLSIIYMADLHLYGFIVDRLLLNRGSV